MATIEEKNNLQISDIEVIAIGDRQEKGRALERQVGTLLGLIGYKDIKMNRQKIAEEIDLTARSKFSNEPLKVECKAHAKKIGNKDVQKFHSKWAKEHGKSPRTIGMLISLSGFSPTALAYYEDFCESDKQQFQLIDDEELLQYLIKEGILCSIDLLNTQITQFTSLPVKKIRLLFSERGLFWEITTSISPSGQQYLFFLNGNAQKFPSQVDSEYILQRIDINEKKVISLRDRHKILESLYAKSYSSGRELAEKVNEAIDDVQVVVDELIAAKIVRNNNGNIQLRQEIETLIQLFQESRNYSIVNFMISDYYATALHLVIPYVQSKFSISFDEGEKKILEKVLLISPSCVDFCLFGDTKRLKKMQRPLENPNLPPTERDEILKMIHRDFTVEIFTKLHADINRGEFKDLFLKQDLKLLYTKLEIRLATLNLLYLKGECELPLLLAKIAPGQSVEPGDLLSAENPDLYNEVCVAFIHIEKYDNALKTFNDALKAFPGHPNLWRLHYNKGICLMRMKKFDEAIGVLISLLDLQQAKENSLKNLAECYWIKGNIEKFNETCQALIDNHYVPNNEIENFKEQIYQKVVKLRQEGVITSPTS